MGYGAVTGKVSDTRLVSVYCSNTAAGVLYKGYLASLKGTNTVLNANSGVGFGAAVDHNADTNSVVVGILGGGRSDHNYWGDATWGQAVTRGPLASVYVSGTVTAGHALYAHAQGDGAAYCTETDVHYIYSFVGYPLTATSTNVTSTIQAFINTFFA